jgi:uncharacterized protein YndB with AHSA1/START domain
VTDTEHRPADIGGEVITVDQYLPHPPARAWQALTDSEQLAAWFMPNDFVPVVGRAFTLHRSGNCDLRFSSTIACRVLAVEPERLLSYSWTDGGEYAGELDSTVTWTLHPEGRGTRVFVEHRGFRPDDPVHQAARALMDDGWHIYVGDRLAGHLDRTGNPAAPTQEVTR